VPEPEKKPPESKHPDSGGLTPGAAGAGATPAGASDELAPEVRAMADSCFARAAEATARNNFDYAIHLYLDGLRYNPKDIEKGHRGLRDCALRRRNLGKGGGIAAMFSQVKGMMSQTIGRHKDQLLSLEETLARDPQNVMLLTQLMQTARRLDYPDLAVWFGELAAEETLRAKKPQKQIFITLADLYEAHEKYQEAVNALTQAIKIDPSDRMLGKRSRDLAARSSIKTGKLDSMTDFRDMIRDKAGAAQSATQQVVRTQEQLEVQYAEYKAALEADPKNCVKMERLADCQARRGNIDEAMALLQKARDLSKEYRYKQRMDDIHMGEFRRGLRDLADQIAHEPGRADLKAKRQEVIAQANKFELEVFVERQRQYPTDMSIRYELGVRQLRSGQIDDAIVSFQNTTRDPKRKVDSLNQLGKCFHNKKLFSEAQSQFETAIQQYEIADNALGKDLRYNLAKTFEAQGKLPQAIEWYSVIVQQDYQYRDAAKRLEALRKGADSGQGGSAKA
jgi:tetratricopeptide (TPR) repeat protein